MKTCATTNCKGIGTVILTVPTNVSGVKMSTEQVFCSSCALKHFTKNK